MNIKAKLKTATLSIQAWNLKITIQQQQQSFNPKILGLAMNPQHIS